MQKLMNDANIILQAAIDSVKPHRLIEKNVKIADDILIVNNRRFDLRDVAHIYVIGMGKASAVMANKLEDRLGNRITGGQVIVKYGHGEKCKRISIREAGHPVLDENGLRATEELLEIAQKAGENDLVICLISGGGSALFEKLPAGISLTDLRKTVEMLLACGASIEEINAVRKHLSEVKGGRLAKAIAPAKCLGVIISDVIGDPLDAIASGPTAPDTTTFADAWKVLKKYDLRTGLPESIIRHLQTGMQNPRHETIKPGDPVFKNVHHFILGNNFIALTAAEAAANALRDYQTIILTGKMQGEAREAARVIAAIAEEVIASGRPLGRPACLIFGGETTVTLRGNGKGGRNQEFALAALLALSHLQENYLLLSCGTDGTDGPTDAAGAFASPKIWKIAKEKGVNPAEFLAENDAYHFFEQTGGLIKTGPTGTNVMDIGIVLIP